MPSLVGSEMCIRDSSETAVHAAAIEEDAHSYLGYPPGTVSVEYSCLVDKLPGLLCLVQAAHRVGQASATNLVKRPRSMGRDTLENARKRRLRLAVESSAATFATALEAVNQRMGEPRPFETATLKPRPLICGS